ncbi:MAG TPA: phage minor head protein, partial [Hyphomicrobiales bacterium]|nr:phage minor head protein [Hyphomicrobiales bacterium]
MAGVDKASKLFETAPEEVVRYFDERRSLPSFDWRDVAPSEHALGFTVAKTAGYDVLGDLRAATRQAVVDRIPFEKFRDELEPTLIAKGWWGKKSAIDPKTGETVTVQLGSPRRLRTIYWANTRSAHAAGEWERTERTKAFLPFLLYTLSTAEHKRPLHAEWARKPVVLPVDDPWWNSHYPPNGWLCQCGVRQITRREAVARGYTPETVAPALDERPWLNKRTGEVEMVPNGIDPGWATNPGKRRARNVADHLAGRLDAMDEDARRTAIADMTGSKLFRAIQGGDIAYPPGKVDPAILTPGEMRRRNIAAPVATISEDVAA